MEELWSAQCLFYSLTEDYSNFVQQKTVLDRAIDRMAMQRALDTAITRYPYFKVKLVRTGEELALADNDAPLLVYGDADSPTLEPDRNGGYLLRVSVKGDTLNVSFCHAMTDGRGIRPFVLTLLHYYWLYAEGIDSGAPDVRLAGSPIPPGEIRDPMLDFRPDENAVTLPAKDLPPYMLPVERDPSGRKYVFSFSMDADSFMECAREIDGSPNAMMALSLSRAIHTLHPDAENIVAGVAADLRHADSESEGHHCQVGLLKIPYLPKMDRMDLTTCATCYRGSIILQSDDDVLRAGLAASQQFNYYLKGLKTLEEKCRVSVAAVRRGSGGATFSVSYPGKQDFGAINSHIRFIQSIVDAQVMHMALEIKCVENSFFITVTQDFPDGVYVRELLRQLGDWGIACGGYRAESVAYVPGPAALKV